MSTRHVPNKPVYQIRPSLSYKSVGIWSAPSLLEDVVGGCYNTLRRECCNTQNLKSASRLIPHFRLRTYDQIDHQSSTQVYGANFSAAATAKPSSASLSSHPQSPANSSPRYPLANQLSFLSLLGIGLVIGNLILPLLLLVHQVTEQNWEGKAFIQVFISLTLCIVLMPPDLLETTYVIINALRNVKGRLRNMKNQYMILTGQCVANMSRIGVTLN